MVMLPLLVVKRFTFAALKLPVVLVVVMLPAEVTESDPGIAVVPSVNVAPLMAVAILALLLRFNVMLLPLVKVMLPAGLMLLTTMLPVCGLPNAKEPT